MHQLITRPAVARLLLFTSLSAAPAYADDLSVSTGLTSPVATATAANNTPGNITIAAAGSVIVGSGTAATLNSNNTLSNAGTISSTAISGTTAVLIDGSAAGGLSNATFINTGTISITGTGGSGNTGLLIANGPVTGSVQAGTASTISVTGDNALGASIAAPFTGDIALRNITVTGTTSTAVSVTAPITGNLTLAGSISSTGAGGYGLLVSAPVSGTINNASTITLGTAQTLNSSNVIVPAVLGIAGIRIGASVGGGFVNDRYYVDASGNIVPPASVDTTVDILTAGNIAAIGAPALIVAPNAASPVPITLGAVGTGDDAFAIVNRGVLRTSAGSSGTAALALQVGGGGATTTLAGGINNQATATIAATSLDASATAVDLQAGAVVPLFKNAGAIGAAGTATVASGSVAAGAGGAAYGVIVEAGASLPSLLNPGAIVVSATGANNGAYGIVDRSGTLTSIVNSGTITATSTIAGNVTRAVDVTASAANVVLTNSGTITGDIAFGNGNSTLQLTGGTISGAVGFGTGSNLLALSGTAVLSSAIVSPGALAVTLTDTARLDLSKSAVTLASIAASGNAVLAVPVGPSKTALTVTGAASFTQNSVIQLSLQSVSANQSLTVVQANGGISTDHLATLIDATTAPYLFTATAPTLTADSLSITLTRKTADQIGLTGGQAALFNSSLVALSSNSAESSAIANLPNQAAVIAAYRQIAPPSAGRGPLRVAQSIADSGFGAAADRLAIVDDIRHGGTPGLGVWIQEIGNFTSQADGVNELAFHTDGFGLAGGIDHPLLGLDAVGLAFVTNWTTLHQSNGAGLPELSTPISTQGVEPYLSWSWKPLFVEATGLAAHVSYRNTRTITLGTLADQVVSNWSGTQLGAGLTAGARLDFGHFRVTPSNAISWTSLTQNSYTEQGGGPLALAVAKQKDSVTSDTARLSLAYLHAFNEGLLRFEAHGGYVHQFNARPTTTLATFIGGGDPTALPGDAVRAEELSYGGAVGFTEQGIAIKFGYDRRQSTGFHDQSLAVTAGIAF